MGDIAQKRIIYRILGHNIVHDDIELGVKGSFINDIMLNVTNVISITHI